jgi:hypothetical protein
MITASSATPTEVLAPADQRQHIAAQLIGAQPMMTAGRLQLVDNVEQLSVEGRPEQCDDRDADEAGGDDRTEPQIPIARH